jgi:hypothetical protein
MPKKGLRMENRRHAEGHCLASDAGAWYTTNIPSFGLHHLPLHTWRLARSRAKLLSRVLVGHIQLR